MGAAERTNPFNQWKKAEDGFSQFKLYDRLGREIGKGDVVYLIEKRDAMWYVESIAPVMDPKLPPGLLQIRLVSTIKTPLPGGQPVLDMLKAMDAVEARPYFKEPSDEAGHRNSDD